MTQQELSALVNEVKQLQGERSLIEDRAAHIGVTLMEAYPVEERPELVCALLDDIDEIL